MVNVYRIHGILSSQCYYIIDLLVIEVHGILSSPFCYTVDVMYTLLKCTIVNRYEQYGILSSPLQ